MSRASIRWWTVVDAANLLRDYASTDFLKDRGEALGEEDNRALVNLLVDQIEFADVIILNKIDAAEPEQLEAARKIIRSLNTDAEVIETSMSRVPLDKVLNTGRFDHDKAQQHPLWFKELYGFAEHKPETEEYGVRSFVYQARRPFHPEKFHAFINATWPGVIRAKGRFWLANRPEWVGELSQAGALVRPQGRGLLVGERRQGALARSPGMASEHRQILGSRLRRPPPGNRLHRHRHGRGRDPAPARRLPCRRLPTPKPCSLLPGVSSRIHSQSGSGPSRHDRSVGIPGRRGRRNRRHVGHGHRDLRRSGGPRRHQRAGHGARDLAAGASLVPADLARPGGCFVSSSPTCSCPARRPSKGGRTASGRNRHASRRHAPTCWSGTSTTSSRRLPASPRSDLVDVRLERVSHDSCWKFHRDFVEARLLTTYRGPGTEWVQPIHAERALRAQKRFKGPLEHVRGNDVALFKGNCAGPGSGIVHRSPPIAGTGCTRLLLALNRQSAASPEPWPGGVEHETPPETGFMDIE